MLPPVGGQSLHCWDYKMNIEINEDGVTNHTLEDIDAYNKHLKFAFRLGVAVICSFVVGLILAGVIIWRIT